MKKIKLAMGVLLSFGLTFTFVGCKDKGSEVSEVEEGKTQKSTKKENITTKIKDELSNVTYEGFKDIKVGSTYSDCVASIGEANEYTAKEDESSEKTYKWDMGNNTAILVKVTDEIVVNKSQVSLNNTISDINKEQYESILEGMTVDEIFQIIGEGRLTLEERTSDGKIKSFYSYYNEDYSSAILTVIDGLLYSKSQNNLKE